MSLFAELKRRNVFRVAAAYVIAGWLLVQALELAADAFEAPPWVIKMIIAAVIIGIVPTVLFSWAYELTPEGIKREHEVERDESITHQTAKKLDMITIGLVVLGIGVLFADRYLLPDRFVPAQKTADTVDEQVTRAEPDEVIQNDSTVDAKSIAVLPFVNMSADKEQEYFSDGITEEILNALAKVKQLKVAGRTSSFAFKGKSDDLRLIGHTLGVAHILEGSVRKSGTTVRITAQLIQVEDGFHLWSERYDRELTDIFAIQDEIAAAILTQLKTQLLDQDADVHAASVTDSEVYNLYLLAKQRIYSRQRPLLESAVELLDQAIKIDPGYAPAYAQRAIVEMLLSDRDYGETPVALAHARGKKFADKSLELDANLAEGWAALGLYHAARKTEHQQAIEALTKALEINPNLIDASNWLQTAYDVSGNFTEALRLSDHMVNVDPLYAPGFNNAIGHFSRSNQIRKAQALIEKVRPFKPDDPEIDYAEGITHFYSGRMAQANQLFGRAAQKDSTNVTWHLIYGFSNYIIGDYERVAAEAPDWAKIIALLKLRRIEEASILADKLASFGFIDPLFMFYNRTGQSSRLIDYLEKNWPDLDAFEKDHPHNTFGYSLMANIALAYARSDNEARFNDALSRLERALDKLNEHGVDNFFLDHQHAVYYSLAGDSDKAIDALTKAIDRGMLPTLPLADEEPAFGAIAFDPRIAELETRVLANLNEVRKTLGLEPVVL